MANLLGISTWSFPWAVGVKGYPQPEHPLSLEDLLHRAHKLQVGVVQIADNFPLHDKTQAELLQLKAIADRLGLAIEVGTKGVEPAHLRQYLSIAKILGANLIRTLTHSEQSRPDIRQASSWIKQVAPELEAQGVSLAVENYERHSAAEFSWLVQEVNSPNVGICLDTVNSFGALEGTDVVFTALAQYTLNLHIKDFAISRVESQMGFALTGKPAGTGHLEVKTLVSKLQSLHKQPNIILEQWPPFLGTIDETVANETEWAKQSIAFLQEVVSELGRTEVTGGGDN